MKKAICTLAVMAALMPYRSLAQETGSRHISKSKAYIRAGLGYAFAHAGANDFAGLPVNSTTTTSTNSGSFTSTRDVKPFSFGAGLNGTLAAGYMFHPNVGLELAVTGILGPKRYIAEETVSSSFASGTERYTTYARTSIAVIPSVVFKVPGRKVDLYSRLGLAIPVAGKMIIEGDWTSSLGESEETEREATSRFSLGIAGALGVNYHVTSRLGVWLEVNGISRNAFAKRMELTKAVEDGVNVLSLYDTDERVVEFESEYTEGSGAQNPNLPSREQTFAIPYSNIGFAVGVSFGL